MSEQTADQSPAEPTPDAAPTSDPQAAATGDAAQNPVKDPSEWTTGDEPITGPQASYLQTLAQEAGETVPDNLTKAQASEMIDRLQGQTGRGQGS